VQRPSKTTPHRLAGHDPPSPGVDPELDEVGRFILAKDPFGETFASVLRETYDQLYDGARTGRYSWTQLKKTEKTYMGTLIEINLHRAFDFADGKKMDYLIEGVDTDCKFSQDLGGWEIPPEAYEGRHVCLVVWASEDHNRWEAGLVRVINDARLLGPENRDGKRRLTPAGESTIRWLYSSPTLPENLLLHIEPRVRERILDPMPASGPRISGQGRVNMLFRLVQRRLVNRASLETVAQQKDGLKRARDARRFRHLGREGILVLGHQEDDPLVARALGLAVPKKGDFVSARVHPAEARFFGQAAEIDGARWRLAGARDPVVPAPTMRRSLTAKAGPNNS
jgi:Restriction endonuclease NaeI